MPATRRLLAALLLASLFAGPALAEDPPTPPEPPPAPPPAPGDGTTEGGTTTEGTTTEGTTTEGTTPPAVPPGEGPAGTDLPPPPENFADLLGDLSDPSPRVREDAARAIGRIGPAARSAIPLLVRALSPNAPGRRVVPGVD